MIEELDLAAYLASKGVQVYRSAGQEVTAHCFWCLDGDHKGKGKLYLNADTWLYKCFRCDASGNRKTLLEHFGDEDGITHAAGSDPSLRRRILTETAEFAHEMLLANEAKAQYLLDRGISEDLIVEQKLGYVPKNVGISEMLPVFQNGTAKRIDLIGAGVMTISGKEFFSDSIVIPYWSHGSVVQLREKQIQGKYRSMNSDSTVRLFNSDALLVATDVLITEGEFDALRVTAAIRESGDRLMQSIGVVGLPGAGVWPDGLVPMLDRARKVFIGLDPDDTGKKFAAKLSEAIGGKARVVRLPEELPKTDWTDWFKPKTPSNPHGGHTWRDLRDLLTEADLAGKRLFTVTDAAAKWKRSRKEAPGLKLGWPSLDAVLRPGVKPGQLMIPLARTGTGKTVWLSNIAHNLRDKRVLYISLEMTAVEVFEHLRRIHRFWFPTAPQEQVAYDNENLRIIDQNRIGKGDLGEIIREYTEDVGAPPEVLIVDYLQYYARGFRGDAYERVNAAVMELKAVAKEEGLGIICPSQVNRGSDAGKPLTLDDARDSGVIEETGDFVIGLFRPDQMVNKNDPDAPQLPQNGSFKVQILKSRHGGVGRVFDLRMSLMSLAVVDVLFDRKAALRVDQENSLARQGVHYDDFRRQKEDEISQRELRFA